MSAAIFPKMLPHEGNARTCLAIRAGPGMKLHPFPETDSLYVEFKAGPGVETREVPDALNVGLDSADDVVGFDFDRASRRLDLSRLETGPLTGKGR